MTDVELRQTTKRNKKQHNACIGSQRPTALSQLFYDGVHWFSQSFLRPYHSIQSDAQDASTPGDRSRLLGLLEKRDDRHVALSPTGRGGGPWGGRFTRTQRRSDGSPDGFWRPTVCPTACAASPEAALPVVSNVATGDSCDSAGSASLYSVGSALSSPRRGPLSPTAPAGWMKRCLPRGEVGWVGSCIPGITVSFETDSAKPSREFVDFEAEKHLPRAPTGRC